MKIIPFIKPTRSEMGEAVNCLKNGGLVVFPTETCYGIGVDATNSEAVEKLLEYKGGRENKPISVAVSSKEMAKKYVLLNEMAENIYTNLLPGPVTVVSKDRGKVAKALVSDLGTLGVRIPKYQTTLKLIENFGKPITATSANTSGKKQPYALSDWEKYTSLSKQRLVDVWLDAGTLPYHPPSTLVDTTLNELTILRQGEIEIPKATKVFESLSVRQTQEMGEELMSSLITNLADKPIIIAIQGDLGAGKTQMAKGIARALKIKETVNSPTYTIMREYQYNLDGMRGWMYHIDTWRLHDGKELIDLGFEDLLINGNVIVIEWLQKMRELLQTLAQEPLLIWMDIKEVNKNERRIRWWR